MSALLLSFLTIGCGRIGFATRQVLDAGAGNDSGSLDVAEEEAGAGSDASAQLDASSDGAPPFDAPSAETPDSMRLDATLDTSSPRDGMPDAVPNDTLGTESSRSDGGRYVRITSPVDRTTIRGSFVTVEGTCSPDVSSVSVAIGEADPAPPDEHRDLIDRPQVVVPCIAGRFATQALFLRAYAPRALLPITADSNDGSLRDVISVAWERQVGPHLYLTRIGYVTRAATMDADGYCPTDALVVRSSAPSFDPNDCLDGGWKLSAVPLAVGENLVEIELRLVTGERFVVAINVFRDVNSPPAPVATLLPGAVDAFPLVQFTASGFGYPPRYMSENRDEAIGHCIVAADSACTDIRSVRLCQDGIDHTSTAWVTPGVTTTLYAQTMDRSGRVSPCVSIGTVTPAPEVVAPPCDRTVMGPNRSYAEVQAELDTLYADRATTAADGAMVLCFDQDLEVRCSADECTDDPGLVVGDEIASLSIRGAPAGPVRFFRQTTADIFSTAIYSVSHGLTVENVEFQIGPNGLGLVARRNSVALVRSVRARSVSGRPAIELATATRRLESIDVESTIGEALALSNAVGEIRDSNVRVSGQFGVAVHSLLGGGVAIGALRNVRLEAGDRAQLFRTHGTLHVGEVSSCAFRRSDPMSVDTPAVFNFDSEIVDLGDALEAKVVFRTLNSTGNQVCSTNGQDFADIGSLVPTAVSNGAFGGPHGFHTFPWGPVSGGGSHPNAPNNLQGSWGGACP